MTVILHIGKTSNTDTISLRPTMKYKVVLKKTDEGYSSSCPGLPGCWSQGDTELEAIENIKDAIQEYLGAISESIQNADVREIEVAV